MEIFKLFGSIFVKDEASKALDKVEKKADGVNKKMGFNFKDVGKKATDLGKKLETRLTLPITGVGVVAGKLGMDFEASMSNVSALSGATGNDLKQLENKAREMGSKTSKSAKDAADAMGYMALAGWKNKDIMGGIEPVLRLAEAGNLDLAQASALTTDSLSAMGLTVKDLPHYLDVVAQTARSSNTDIDQMAEAYIGVGGTLKGLNVPMEESAVILGMLANKGIKGSEAGTALNAVVTNLTAPTGRAEEALSDLGLTAFDSNGKFKGLSNVLMELKDKTKDMTEEERQQTLAMIGGKEHVKDLNALLSGLDGDYSKLTKDIGEADGALNDMASTMQNNNKGSITELKSALEELGLKIYDNLKPAIADIVTKLQEWTDKLNSLSPEQQKMLIKIAGIIAILPVLIHGFGTVCTGIDKMKKAFDIGKTAVGGMGKALGFFATHPIALVITAVGALTIFIVTHWEQIKEVTTKVFNAISSFLGSIWNGIKAVITTVVNAIKTVITSVWNIIKTVTTTIWNCIKIAIVTPIQGAKTIITTVVNGIKSVVTSVWNSIKSVTTSVWNGIKTAMVTPINAAKNRISGIINTIKGFFSNLKLKFPKIEMPPLPHFSLQGKFSLKEMTVPKLRVKWYSEGGIFPNKTILGGIGVGDANHGFGNNAEAVVPLDMLWKKLDENFDKLTQNDIDEERIAKILARILKETDKNIIINFDSREVARVTAKPMSEELGKLNRRGGRY